MELDEISRECVILRESDSFLTKFSSASKRDDERSLLGSGCGEETREIKDQDELSMSSVKQVGKWALIFDLEGIVEGDAGEGRDIAAA